MHRIGRRRNGGSEEVLKVLRMLSLKMKDKRMVKSAHGKRVKGNRGERETIMGRRLSEREGMSLSRQRET